MRKIILNLALSLDNYIEGPNGEYDWCLTDQDYGMSDLFARTDAIFIGRKSYEMSLGMEDMDTSWMPPKMKEYVFSNTLETVKEGAVLVSGDLKTAVEQIKNEPGKDIWLFGGADLTGALMELNLVDELWLAVHPILLGAGKPLFNNIKERVPLHLVDSKTWSTGLVTLRYTL